ncbi:MAG TPA: efflux transporter outer membrane subunit [Vulgatibacter sp.]|nr:efflux transporter outer membrane subunit [Vulgatibacter sp.]
MAEVRGPGIAAAALSLALAGCTMAPTYARPEAPIAEAYPAQTEGEADAALLGWRDVFGDERLQALIELALENNRDLRVATLNVERLRALYRIQRAPLLPSVNATGSATFQELPEGVPGRDEQYAATLNVTAWELDFFGRIRSLADAALERYFATAEARRSAHLSLVSQVAIAHFTERALAEQLELARGTLELVEESFAITRRAFELGTASELDLRTSESQVETARFNVALYEQRHAQAVNALVFLVGAPLPADLPGSVALADAKVLIDLPAGLPSDLLQRRPDILAAEHELMAANASIGAARAAFFPSISLTGVAGFGSAELGELFGGDGFTWLFSPRIDVPIFQGGALRASLDAAEISKAIEVARYQRAIQAAFREVSDALVGQRALADQLDAQEARVAANERRYDLANRRYRAGIDSYVTLLTAQQDLYRSQELLIDARFNRLANVANLYRALGGGWKETAEETPVAPEAG